MSVSRRRAWNESSETKDAINWGGQWKLLNQSRLRRCNKHAKVEEMGILELPHFLFIYELRSLLSSKIFLPKGLEISHMMKEVAPLFCRTRIAILGTDGNAYRSNCFQSEIYFRLRRNILLLRTVILNLLAQSNHFFVRARSAFQGFWVHQSLSSFSFLLILLFLFLPVLLKLGPVGFVVAWSLWELGPLSPQPMARSWG